MNRDELLALADRVEQASGPNFELERLIWIAVGAPAIRPVPVYTASLDAAVTLVPDGWRLYTADMSVKDRTRWMLAGPKTEWVEGLDGLLEAGADWYQQGVAATPALALCAACLRAKANAL